MAKKAKKAMKAKKKVAASKKHREGCNGTAIASNDPLGRSEPLPRTLACVVFARAEDQARRQGFVV